VGDASRYIEAAGDIGIPIDAVETAIGRLNKTIGMNPDAVRNLGIDLVYLKDGSLDVNETFKNTIDRIKGIKDPAEKARVAAQTLGKGWRDLAELIAGGSAAFEKSLASVSDQQVISDEELQKAKDYRAAMDGLGDATKKLKLKAGSDFIPLVTAVANGVSWVIDLNDRFNNLFKGQDPIGDAVAKLQEFAQNMRDARDDNDKFKESIKKARVDAIVPFKEKIVETTTALLNADTAWKTLTTSLDREVSLDNAKTKLGELQAAAALAFGTGAQADINNYQVKAAEFATILATISGTIDGISSKEIYLRFKTEGPAAALELATYLARGAEYGGLSSYDAMTLAGISGGARASGGPVSFGKSYLVGEKGPELFTPSSSGNITPNGALGGGGATVNVTVTSANPDDVVSAIQKWVRQNGSLPLAVTSGIRY
jgi:hypothetical protein